jgi:hypothetical protein
MAIIRPGSDGRVRVSNNAASGSVRVVLDTQGYFTNEQSLPAPYGSSRWRSGSRSDAGMISRSLNDRVATEVNPTTGNLLVTQNLLNLPGIGQGKHSPRALTRMCG